MRTDIKAVIKRAIAMSGVRPSYRLDFLNGLLKLGLWIRENDSLPQFEDRFDLYAYLNKQLVGSQPIEYFEFGVYKGDSLREWLRVNRHPESRFWGFDSFKGLPETWQRFTSATEQGAFDLHGDLPRIADDRASLVPGYFQDTLPAFLEHQYSHEPDRRIILHCDADLYSSTLYVLTAMNRLLTPGSILIFDEFSSVLHEFRAFSDFLSTCRRRARGLAAAGPFFSRVAVEVVE